MNRLATTTKHIELNGAESNQACATIVGLGTSVPDFSISQEDACEFAQQIGMAGRFTKALPKLYRQSGVSRRHSVFIERSDGPALQRQSFYPVVDPSMSDAERKANVPTTADRMEAYRKFAPALALQAASRAVAASELNPCEITHLVTVSCSGFCAPGVDIELIQALGLSNEVQRTHVGFMGCHGSLNGMRVARAICESQPAACVLLVSVEICSLHQHYTDNPQQLVANSLFADGAAAIVVQSTSNLPSDAALDANDSIVPRTNERTTEMLESDSSRAVVGIEHKRLNIELISNASTVLPDTQAMMSWQVGDHGFEMGLSPQVPEVIQARLYDWIAKWLSEHELSVADIVGWNVHPGGPRILTATAEALTLADSDLSASWNTLRDYGNMSSPTVFFVLNQILSQGVSGPVVMLGFGPGLCVEAALLNI